MTEENVYSELRNVVRNAPVWPGDTLSHATVKECASRGWVERNEVGDWVATLAGVRALAAWPWAEEGVG